MIADLYFYTEELGEVFTVCGKIINSDNLSSFRNMIMDGFNESDTNKKLFFENSCADITRELLNKFLFED